MVILWKSSHLSTPRMFKTYCLNLEVLLNLLQDVSDEELLFIIEKMDDKSNMRHVTIIRPIINSTENFPFLRFFKPRALKE